MSGYLGLGVRGLEFAVRSLGFRISGLGTGVCVFWRARVGVSRGVSGAHVLLRKGGGCGVQH